MTIVWIALGAFLFWRLQDYIYKKYWDRQLSAGLCFSQESLTEGEEGCLEVWVENRKLLPLPALKVKFQVSRNLVFEAAGNSSIVTDQYYRNDVLSVRPYMRHVRKLPFIGKKRGYYEINSIGLVAVNLFLSGELPKTLSCKQEIYVYPRPFAGREFTETLQRLNGEVLSKRHLLEDPFEYRGIREYGPFDSMRDVNWKASARTGDLKVNIKGYTALKAVRLFLNLEDGALLRRMELLEASIGIACAIAGLFLQEGIRVAFYTNGADILTKESMALSAGAGEGHMEALQRLLSRIDLEDKAPPFVAQQAGNILEAGDTGESFTVFISANTQADFQNLLCTCQDQNMDFAWICPRGPKEEEKPEYRLESFWYPVSVEEGM